MDLTNAIYNGIKAETEKLNKEMDEKKKKAIIRQRKKYRILLRRIVLKEEYMSFINNEYTTYTAKDFKGKKIMSDKEYNKLMVEWSEKVGEQLLSANEEYVRENMEIYRQICPNKTEEQYKLMENSFRQDSKRLKEQEDARKELQHEREIWWEQYRKMTPEEKEHYYEELCGPTIGSAKRVYKNTITLKKDDKE